jgi:hypothetical protein
MRVHFFFLIAALCGVLRLQADSPLTSTYFAEAYADVPAVKRVIDWRNEAWRHPLPRPVLDKELWRFLDDTNVPCDHKIAFLNALGWGDSTITADFIAHFEKKYNQPKLFWDDVLSQGYVRTELSYGVLSKMHYHDLAMLAYAQAMGDYFNAARAVECGTIAGELSPGSETVMYVNGLIIAQAMLDISWCNVYLVMKEVRDEYEYNTDLLRPEAIASIFEYIGMYEQACVGVETSAATEEEPWYYKMTAEYWEANPVIEIPASIAEFDPKNFADLKLLNEKDGIHGNWVVYDDVNLGTSIVVKCKNVGNAASPWTNVEIRAPGIDNIGTVVLQRALPPIAPGAEMEVKFIIEDIWIYDPDMELEIVLDELNIVPEKDESDNAAFFFEMG